VTALQMQGIGLLGRTNHHGYFYAIIARELWLEDASISKPNRPRSHQCSGRVLYVSTSSGRVVDAPSLVASAARAARLMACGS
jgi:hypothetical protein